MTDEEYARTKRYVEIWKQTAVELDRIKCEELRAMTEAEGRQQAGEVMEMGGRWLATHPVVRHQSGLVEQQKFFAKWKTLHP